MALYKRENSSIWWVDIAHEGKRIRRSTGTSNKLDAKRYHDKLKHDLWSQTNLDEIPNKTWIDASVRWLHESTHKRSLASDKKHLRWLDPYLKNFLLCNITTDTIEEIARQKESTGVKAASVNRMLALIRAILRKANNEWGWLHKLPSIRMRKNEDERERWLTKTEAQRLIEQLPEHLADMAVFTLATGLRARNVRELKWSQVDMKRCHAWVGKEKIKNKKPLPVPLNEEAMRILRKRLHSHPEYVFAYKGKTVCQCSTRAWRNALKRAGISNFRWHDLRHTWASWHVQSGTSLQELQQLGGWSNFKMVLRYAHLSSDHLRLAAERVNVTFTTQHKSKKYRGNI